MKKQDRESLQAKTTDELKAQLKEVTGDLAKAQVEVHVKRPKDVHAIYFIKKDIARLRTIITARKLTEKKEKI